MRGPEFTHADHAVDIDNGIGWTIIVVAAGHRHYGGVVTRLRRRCLHFVPACDRAGSAQLRSAQLNSTLLNRGDLAHKFNVSGTMLRNGFVGLRNRVPLPELSIGLRNVCCGRIETTKSLGPPMLNTWPGRSRRWQCSHLVIE